MATTNSIASAIFRSLHKNIGDSNQAAIKPGQIITGKVLQLYPNQRANIQLGSQQMVAQLEAALNLNDVYWFQVQSVGQLIKLKVLSDRPANTNKQRLEQLLSELGIKATKDKLNLLQILVNQRLPFQKEHLLEALRLLDKAQNKQQSQDILVEMFKRKLPIRSSIFDALTTRKMTDFNTHFSSLTSDLNHVKQPSIAEGQLIGRLNSFQNNFLSKMAQQILPSVLLEAEQGNQSIFNLLQTAGIVSTKLNFTEWQSAWSDWMKQNNFPANGGSVIAEETQKLTSLPFQIDFNSDSTANKLTDLWRQQLTLTPASRHQIDLLMGLLNGVGKETSGAVRVQIETLNELLTNLQKQGTLIKLLPHLAPEQQSFIDYIAKTSSVQSVSNFIDNNRTTMVGLLPSLRSLSQQQVGQDSENLLLDLASKIPVEKQQLFLQPKEFFLLQLKSTLQFMGYQYEHDLQAYLNKETQSPDNQSVKHLLLQLFQDGEARGSERAGQLLQFINGIQLTSQQEIGNFLQMSLQLPGGKLGLGSDIHLDIEGQKQETDEINPDFCHILFYLNLEKMKETVIDMNIQKRMVHVTIYNSNPSLVSIFSDLKPMLKKGLEQHNYHLPSVKLKDIDSEAESRPSKLANTNRAMQRGVDFKI